MEDFTNLFNTGHEVNRVTLICEGKFQSHTNFSNFHGKITQYQVSSKNNNKQTYIEFKFLGQYLHTETIKVIDIPVDMPIESGSALINTRNFSFLLENNHIFQFDFPCYVEKTGQPGYNRKTGVFSGTYRFFSDQKSMNEIDKGKITMMYKKIPKVEITIPIHHTFPFLFDFISSLPNRNEDDKEKNSIKTTTVNIQMNIPKDDDNEFFNYQDMIKSLYDAKTTFLIKNRTICASLDD